MKNELEKSKGAADVKKSIVRFLTTADVVLTAEQERILSRWEFADHLLRAHTEHTDIILKITGKFSVSKFTAENDVSNAMEVFSRSRRINKKYIVHLNLERLNRFITHMEAGFYAVNKEQQIKPDAKMVAAMARLYETYTYTANSLPDDDVRKPTAPPVFLFSLPQGVAMAPVASLEDAMRDADEIISDIDFEETTKSEDDTTTIDTTNGEQSGE